MADDGDLGWANGPAFIFDPSEAPDPENVEITILTFQSLVGEANLNQERAAEAHARGEVYQADLFHGQALDYLIRAMNVTWPWVDEQMKAAVHDGIQSRGERSRDDDETTEAIFNFMDRFNEAGVFALQALRNISPQEIARYRVEAFDQLIQAMNILWPWVDDRIRAGVNG